MLSTKLVAQPDPISLTMYGGSIMSVEREVLAELKSLWIPVIFGYGLKRRAIAALESLFSQLEGLETEIKQTLKQRDDNRQRFAEALGELRRRTGDNDWIPSIDRR